MSISVTKVNTEGTNCLEKQPFEMHSNTVFGCVFAIDSQRSEVAKMLYQQGLTELVHSSPSEQVAYLLVERASLLESSAAPHTPTADGNIEVSGKTVQDKRRNEPLCEYPGFIKDFKINYITV